jgi:hypothetical protein
MSLLSFLQAFGEQNVFVWSEICQSPQWRSAAIILSEALGQEANQALSLTFSKPEQALSSFTFPATTCNNSSLPNTLAARHCPP